MLHKHEYKMNAWSGGTVAQKEHKWHTNPTSTPHFQISLHIPFICCTCLPVLIAIPGKPNPICILTLCLHTTVYKCLSYHTLPLYTLPACFRKKYGCRTDDRKDRLKKKKKKKRTSYSEIRQFSKCTQIIT